MPARAAARVEQASKKGRTATPPDQQVNRSATPSSALNGTPAPDENEEPLKPAAAPLPTSIQPGKPLPTVETPQPEDLPTKDFQSLQERYEISCFPACFVTVACHPCYPCWPELIVPASTVV